MFRYLGNLGSQIFAERQVLPGGPSNERAQKWDWSVSQWVYPCWLKGPNFRTCQASSEIAQARSCSAQAPQDPAQARSSWLTLCSSLLSASSVLLSHGLSCLLIAHITPPCVTRFQIRKELLYESRFHSIIYRDSADWCVLCSPVTLFSPCREFPAPSKRIS